MALGLEGTAAGAVVAGVVGGAAGDFCAQAFSVGMGWQQSIDYKQVAISGAIGGILGYGAYRFFKWCPWGCFTADTPIATPYGPIAIAQITDRDPVWAYNSDGRRTDPLLVPRLTSATYHIALTVDDIAAPADGTVRTPGNHDLVGILDDDLVLQYGQPLSTVAPGTHVCFQGKVYIVLAGPFPGALALVDTGTVLRKVARTFVHPATQLVDLTLRSPDGKPTTVTGTPNHPFYVPALCGYVPMGDLAPGMVLQTTNGAATVETVHVRACESTVYNFEVEGAHNYYVADLRVLVHNSCGSEGAEAAAENAEESVTKSAKDPYRRPSNYRKGIRELVYEAAKDPDGKVYDPVTGNEIAPDDPWVMGHKPQYEFWKHRLSAIRRGITRKQFLDEYNDPSHYRPEIREPNGWHVGIMYPRNWTAR